MRAAHSLNTHMWRSANSTAWTVIYEEDARFQMSCLHRFIYVEAVADLAEALRAADPVRGSVSTVGIAAPDDGRELSSRHDRRLPPRIDNRASDTS